MRHDTLLFVLVPLYLMVIGALLIKDAKRVTVEDKAPVASEVRTTATTEVKADLAPKADESSSKRALTPGCEKELRRTGDLLRLFANRIQMGEDTQSVVADMRQQENKISAACE